MDLNGAGEISMSECASFGESPKQWIRERGESFFANNALLQSIKSCLSEAFAGECLTYYIAFLLFVLWGWLDRTTLWDLETSHTAALFEKAVQAIVMALLAVSFVRQRAKAREWASALALGVLGFVVWRTAAEGWVLWLVLFVICGKGVKLKPLAAIMLLSVPLVLLLASVAAKTGLIENEIVVRSANAALRNPMGFSHPNFFGAALLVASLALVPLIGAKCRFIFPALCVVAAILSLSIADSRTSALCLVASAAAFPIYRAMKRKSMGRSAGYILMAILAVMVALSFGYMVFFDPSRPLDAVLDRLLSGRLRLAHTYYVDHTPGLFGYSYPDGTLYWTGEKDVTFVVDNLFAHVLLRYGLVFCAVFLTALFLLCAKMSKEGYFGPLLFGMAFFLLYGMSETLGCRVECNFYIISLWTVLYHRPISEFDDRGNEGPSDADAISNRADELTFREFVMLPINTLRRCHG